MRNVYTMPAKRQMIYRRIFKNDNKLLGMILVK